MTDLDKLLQGSIDMHLHHGPDLLPRRVDALEAARQAQQVGMRAVVLKNHNYPTAPLAMMVSRLIPGVGVFGSICLDFEIGGAKLPRFRSLGQTWRPGGLDAYPFLS